MRGRSAREIRETNPNSKEDVMTQSITAKNVDTDSINAARSDATTAALLYTPQALSAPPDYVPLTPEGLLVYCQQQLQLIDHDIQDKMDGQNALVVAQNKTTDFENALKSMTPNGVGVTAINDPKQLQTLNTSLDEAISAAKAANNTDLSDALGKVKGVLNGDNNDSLVTSDEVKQMNSMLDSALTASHSTTDTAMIALQADVSKRATVLQLTTGMMNSMDDASKAIAGNIGH
jgi:hypothetical protein